MIPTPAPAPEPASLAAELESWALTQNGSVRALALMVVLLASQTEALAERVAALEQGGIPMTTKRGTR